MRHPKRTITRAIRTRRPLHPGREADELEAVQWPEVAIRVRDRMTRGVATIHSHALVRGAADMMRTRKIRHLPVVDREGRLVGIVTDRDLRQVAPSYPLFRDQEEIKYFSRNLKVAAAMTPDPMVVAPDSPLVEAATKLDAYRIGSLPVVDKEKLVGIISVSDILKAFIEQNTA